MSDKCRYPSCDNGCREYGDLEYPDQPEKTASNGERYTVSRFGAKFCSIGCELRFEKARDDARQAKAEEQKNVDRSDRPEYDGPPY